MGNRTEFAADMLRRIGEDITQYAGVLKWMVPFGDCEAREMGDAFMKRIAVWKALVSDLPPGNDSHPVLDSGVEFKQDGYKTVDLGLPSGLKWSDRNVGAESPEQAGDYFMWGSTEPDTNKPCDWSHAPFNDGSSAFDEAYFNARWPEWFIDKGTLKPEYDAAHAIMGGSWRMPTSVEMKELLDGTTRSVEELNGISGMRFTSKVNGNSIFMPFSGYRNGSDVYVVYTAGNAWSSSLDAGHAGNYSRSLNFSGYGSADASYDARYIGFVVRGVHE